jgi:cob(I)alamin adenosyltransferase
LGTLDELNSSLSFVSNTRVKEIAELVDKLQNDLFEIGGVVANPKSSKKDFLWLEIQTKDFEKQIDKLTKKLPELKNFILPAGSQDSCHLHKARAICRRVERLVVSQNQDKHEYLLKYLNRASDLIFTLARFSNFKLRISEKVWKSRI